VACPSQDLRFGDLHLVDLAFGFVELGEWGMVFPRRRPFVCVVQDGGVQHNNGTPVLFIEIRMRQQRNQIRTFGCGRIPCFQSEPVPAHQSPSRRDVSKYKAADLLWELGAADEYSSFLDHGRRSSPRTHSVLSPSFLRVSGRHLIPRTVRAVRRGDSNPGSSLGPGSLRQSSVQKGIPYKTCLRTAMGTE